MAYVTGLRLINFKMSDAATDAEIARLLVCDTPNTSYIHNKSMCFNFNDFCGRMLFSLDHI